MKTERMEIRVSEDIKNRYQAQADHRGVPLATWALNAMAEQYDREQTTGKIKIPKRDLLIDDTESLHDAGHAIRDLSNLVGEIYYLVKIEYQWGGQGQDHWVLQGEPARTNMSGEPRVRGWCGTTNDIARYAEGRVVVIGQSRTHLHMGVLGDND